MTANTVASRRAVWALLLIVALVAGAIAALIGALSFAEVLSITGLSDPGPVTSYGLSFVRAAGEIAALTAIGHFLFAAFLVPPQASGVLDVDGYRALRIGAVASAVWALCAALLVALTVSDVSGVPLTKLTLSDVWSGAGLIETTAAWRATAILAAVVAVAARAVLRWSWTPALLAGGVVTLVPLAVTGHSSSGGSHDIATNSLLIHLIAGALWVGGLLALLGHAMRGGNHTEVAARRFSGLALWCFAAMAASGFINAAIRLRPADILGSSYGLLVLAKAATLLGLGAVGWRQRRVSLEALQRDPTSRRPLVLLALVEAVLFAAAVGVAVGLGRTPPPPPSTIGEPSPAEVALGFALPNPPTIAAMFAEWRFDLLFGSAAVVMGSIYLRAVYRLRRRGEAWSSRRAASWVFGCLVMLLVTSSGLGKYMTAMFSMHIVAQLLLSIVVPALLVWGAPASLAMAVLQAAGPKAAPGLREWLQSALNSPLTRFATRPWAAVGIFLVGVYGLMVPTVFDAAVGEHSTHMMMVGYFLFSGTVLFAGVNVIEPAHHLRRFVMLLFALTQVAVVGIVLMNIQDVLGEGFYRSLMLDWHTDLLEDQTLGGVIGAAGGTGAILTVAAVLSVRRRKSPDARRVIAAPEVHG